MKKTLYIRCIIRDSYKFASNYTVCIYNKNRLCFVGKTDKFGILKIRVCKYNLYKVVICHSKSFVKYKANIFIRNHNLQYLVVFLREYNINSIKLRVTDKYYKGLPLMKGNINLCLISM